MKESILVWIKTILLTIACFGLFLISSFILYTYITGFHRHFFDGYSIDSAYGYYLRHAEVFILATAIILSTYLFIFLAKKSERVGLVSSFIMCFLISITLAWMLGRACGDSKLWSLKYTIGIITGSIFLLTNKNRLSWKMQLISLLVSLVAMGITEKVEYFKNFDPPSNPTSDNFDGESILIFLAVGLPAYFIPSRILGKLLPK